MKDFLLPFRDQSDLYQMHMLAVESKLKAIQEKSQEDLLEMWREEEKKIDFQTPEYKEEEEEATSVEPTSSNVEKKTPHSEIHNSEDLWSVLETQESEEGA